jgi:cellulose biosynthesis protein BcsE
MNRLTGCWARLLGLSDPVRLPVPIQNLPDDVGSFNGGGCYAIRHSTLALSQRFTQKTLRNARRAGIPFRIFTFQDPRDLSILDQLVKTESLDQSVSFELLPDFLTQLAHHGPASFLRHVEDCLSCTEPSLVIFMDAEQRIHAFSRQNAALIHQLRRWARTWGHMVILSSIQNDASDSNDALFSEFAGVASLISEWHQFFWDVTYWESPKEESTLNRAYGLRFSENEEFSAVGLTYSSIHGEYLTAPDEDRVFYPSSIRSSDSILPSSWEEIKDVCDIESYLQGAMAPTLILHYNKTQSFEDLARLIDQIRREVGRGIKIILKETTIRLRTYQERLLLEIGLNRVVHPFERTQELIHEVESLQGAMFHRRENAGNLDELLASVLPPAAKGYLPSLEFCALLMGRLRLDSPFDVRHVLVRLDLLPGVTQLDALSTFRPNRAGDLMTSDTRELYLFLFGCTPADVTIALSNCFSVELGQLFGFDTQWSTTSVILEQIQELKHRWERQVPEDFSYRLVGQRAAN